MRYKLIDDGRCKTFALIFSAEDEAVEGLEQFARDQKLSAAQFTGIGAFERVTLGYFDWEKKEYEKNQISEQVEVVSLLGDVAKRDGEAKVHAHVVVAKRDATAHGGHLLEAIVRPTLEVILTESPSHLCKKYDPQSGLALIDIEASSNDH